MPALPTLPADRRIDREKIEGYLLHPIKSRGKSAFFLAYGFVTERWQELHDALLAQAAAGSVLEVVVSPYGSRYLVHGTLRTPSGRAPQPTMRPLVFG
jgi:hypothetical protein